jgi:DNA-directed RNA polymerase specialized sigma subunit
MRVLQKLARQVFCLTQVVTYKLDLLHKLCSIWQSTHMRYETVHSLSDEDFRRSAGVQRSTFDTMLKTVKEILRDFGRPPKLRRADQLLLTLMYWREYRTEFHIGLAYGISESAVCRTIKKIENALIESE